MTSQKTNLMIVIDTREKQPYCFQTPVVRSKLDVGDYSLAGLKNYIAIERKTLDDLIGCLCNGRDRFERELHRGKALDYFCVIVEASLTDIARGDYRSQMSPKAAIQSILAFSVRYRLPVFFAENRNYGARITESLLLKFGKELEKRYGAIQQMAA